MTTPPDLDREQGTAVDRTLVWGDWTDNEGFFLNDPSKPTAVQLDRMFERDGKARLLEQALTLPMRQAKLQFTAAKGDRGELGMVQEALTRPANADGMSTPLWQIVGQATSAVAYQRAFFEKVWTVDAAGRFVYDKLAWRPQNSCKIKRSKQGAFEGFKQYVGSEHDGADELGYITVDPAYAWVFIHGAHRNPLAGISDFDVAYHNHVVKQKTRFIYYSLFLEASALPKTAVVAAQGSTQSPKELATTAAALRNGGAAGFPAGTGFHHFPVGQGEAFQQALAYLDADTASSVLAGFTNLTDPAKSGGSNALSESATDFFKMAQSAKLVELGGSLTSWVAADLVRWNFGPGAAVPTIGFEPLTRDDVTTALSALQALADPQTIPQGFTDMLIEELGRRFGLPSDKVAAAIAERQQQAPPTDAEQFKAAVGAGAEIAADAIGQPTG